MLLLQQELCEIGRNLTQSEENLRLLLIPKDADDKSVIMELRGGAGGEEAALFAHSLMRMYTMYVQSRGWELEVLNLNETELGGVKEAILAVNGTGAYNRSSMRVGCTVSSGCPRPKRRAASTPPRQPWR